MGRVIAALMRHGRYEQPRGMPSAHLPHPLTIAGEREARDGAAELAALCQCEGWQIDPVIDSSTLLRAWQTANIVAEELSKLFRFDFKVEEFDALIERGLGAGANLTLSEIASALDRDPRLEALPAAWKREPFFQPPFQGAESLMDSGARVRDHLLARTNEPAEQAGDSLKLFVGHGGCFRHAAVQLGVLPAERARTITMDYGSYVVLERSGQDGWRRVEGEWKPYRPSSR